VDQDQGEGLSHVLNTQDIRLIATFHLAPLQGSRRHGGPVPKVETLGGILLSLRDEEPSQTGLIFAPFSLE
jgi:hypothetical protein